MQKLPIIKGFGHTAKSSSTGKKGKAAGNPAKPASKKAQFSEILGQLAPTLQPVNLTQVKPVTNSKPETAADHVTTSPSNEGGLVSRGKEPESAGGKIETGLARANAQALKHAKTPNQSAAGEASAAQENNNQLADFINGLPARENISNRAGNLKNLKDGDNPMKGPDVTMAEVLPNTDNQVKNPGEFKIADLMAKSGMKVPENKDIRAAAPKLESAPEAVLSPLKSEPSGTAAANRRESSHSRDQETGSGSLGKQTQNTKIEISLTTAENGVVKAEAPATSRVHTAQTGLSQNQTDYLVSKMIQQINVAPSSLEVSLKPEYLGKVSILVQSLEGVVAISVVAQNEEAMNVLNSNLHNIKTSLEQQGINVGQMEVNLTFQERQDHQGRSYQGERREVKETETLMEMDYGTIPYQEQDSASSYQLNLLA